MRRFSPIFFVFLALSFLIDGAAPLWAATRAEWITSSSQLLSGVGAQGQVGDILLSNDRVAFVITSIAHPYGYANTGGNIIDAAAIGGSDEFGQLYTYFDDDWPRQADYAQLTISDDGSGSGVAAVRAQGVESDNSSITVVTLYILADDATQVEVVTTLTNTGSSAIYDFEMGDAFEWADCDNFAPGYGFDVYGTTYQPWMAGSVESLAYGYFAEGQQIWGPNGNGWSDINIEAVDLPASGGQASVRRYLSIATAGIAGVSDAAHAAAGTAVGTLSGSVSRADNGAAIADAVIDVYDNGGSLYTQMYSDGAGEASATLAPGNWRLVVTASGFDPIEDWFTVYLDGQSSFDFQLGSGTNPGSYSVGDILSVIQRPLLNIPAIVADADSFTVNCLADPGTTGWSASLHHDDTIVPLQLESAVYNSGTTWWDLKVRLPESNLHELYDLRVVADGGIDDTTRNAVQVIAGEPSEFYFLHITDTHLPTHLFYDNPESEADTTEVDDLRAIIRDASLINPAFVLHTGDLINEGELEDYLDRKYYSRSQQILGEFEVPLYLIAGNHDIGGWDSTPPSDGTARRDWWRFYGWSILDNPPAGAPLRTQNYSFDFGGVHFTALEAYDNYDMWRSVY